GVPESRVRTEGMGESQPVASNETPEGRANNRRVEIILENPSPSGSQGGSGMQQGGSGMQQGGSGMQQGSPGSGGVQQQGGTGSQSGAGSQPGWPQQPTPNP